jgi:ABC-type bacteriocin/lantibiotic exporter with double-glycine peptidase domain
MLSDISHKYDDKLILNNVNLSINSKDFVAIIGDSGSGKTTLLNIMLGLINPQTGSVTSNDYSISNSPNLWRSTIGYVPQSINLIDENIYKNIALGIEDSLMNKKKIDSILDRLSIINLTKKSDGKELLLGENSQNISGGQNQRIGIAKALYRDPKILILDEFTSALDNENQEKILNTIKKLDVTVIMATHRLNSLTYCNKVFKLQKNLLTQIK